MSEIALEQDSRPYFSEAKKAGKMPALLSAEEFHKIQKKDLRGLFQPEQRPSTSERSRATIRFAGRRPLLNGRGEGLHEGGGAGAVDDAMVERE